MVWLPAKVIFRHNELFVHTVRLCSKFSKRYVRVRVIGRNSVFIISSPCIDFHWIVGGGCFVTNEHAKSIAFRPSAQYTYYLLSDLRAVRAGWTFGHVVIAVEQMQILWGIDINTRVLFISNWKILPFHNRSFFFSLRFIRLFILLGKLVIFAPPPSAADKNVSH